jgi:hypothetical protein
VDGQRQDDEWLQLAMAMSASMDDAGEGAPAVTTVGDYGWVPTSQQQQQPPHGAPVQQQQQQHSAPIHLASRTTRPPLADTTNADHTPAGHLAPHLKQHQQQHSAPIRQQQNIAPVQPLPPPPLRPQPPQIPVSALAQAKARASGLATAAAAARYSVEAGGSTTAAAAAARPPPMWAAAGHGGRDAPLPPGVLSWFVDT